MLFKKIKMLERDWVVQLVGHLPYMSLTWISSLALHIDPSAIRREIPELRARSTL